MRKSLWASVSVLALALPAAVNAQSGGVQATARPSGSGVVGTPPSDSPVAPQVPGDATGSATPSAQTQSAGAGQSAGSATGGGIQDIIVTAQRRTENVQRSSLSIAVVDSANLARQGVTNTRDLSSVLPSVSIAQSGPFVQTNIRGAGDFAANALAQLAVSYSLDGVVIGQGSEIGGNFFDLARVEVLKGPQGTLYGRNATGGAINLVSNRPTHILGGDLTVELGNYNLKRAEGAINLPVTNTLAVRVAFNVIDRDGYLSDGSDDDRRQAVRVQALWDITPGVSIRGFGGWSHTGGRNGGVTLWPPQPGINPWTSYTDPRNVAALAAGTTVTVPQLGTFSLQGPVGNDSYIQNTVYTAGVEFNARLGNFATLTVLPAYIHQDLDSNGYQTAFLTEARGNTDNQTSLEVRLSNQSKKLNWVFGGFYFNDNTRVLFNTLPVTPTGSLLFTRFNTTFNFNSYRNRSLAAFGQATYSLTDRFRVIGGLRYTDDRVSINGRYIDDSLVPQPDYILQGSRTFNAVSWKGGVEYDVAPASLLFFTATRGNKSGGFYAASPVDDSYRPEYLTAFTLGSRNRFFNNQLQVNLELFYWKYRDQQLSAVGFTTDATIAYITRNAGASDPRGVELDAVWKPTRSDTFNLNFAYDHARFSQFNLNFPAPLIAALRVGPDCRVPASPTLVGGLPVFAVNCAGASVPRTPEYSGSFNYGHVFTLHNNANVVFNGGGTFISPRFLTSDFFTPETKDGSHAQFNADLGYISPNKKYSITAFVRNITNEAVYQGAFSNVLNGFPALLGVTGTPNFVARTISPPRTFGVRASVNF